MRTALFVSLPLALTCGLTAQKVNEVEPNDTAATAQPILPGQHITASYATTTDEDWFSFTLAAPGQAHLHTVAQGTLSLGLSRDNRIAFYDATGTTRLAWNDSAVGTMADCGVTLPAGSYTARVALKSGTAVAYDLDFYVLPVNPIDTVEGAEPNDGTGTPTTMTLGDTIEGELSTPADIDYWKFTLTGRGLPQAFAFDDGGVPQLDSMALRFRQETSPGVWSVVGTADAVNSASHRVNSPSFLGLLGAGTYAIEVKAGTTAAGTAPWDLYKTGKYSLRTCLIDMPGTNLTTEGAEPNNNTLTPAGIMALGDDATGFTSGSGDPDWYLVAVGGPTTICAMAEGTGGSPLPGSSIRLWDASGAVSLASGSGNATTHGRLLYTIERAGIYYLEISGAFVATAGDYLLHTGGCAPVFVTTTTRVEPASTNACIGSTGLRPLIGYMSGETPAFGSHFITRIERTIPSSFAAVMLGLSNTTGLGGAVPLPYLLDFGGLDTQVPPQPTPCYIRVDPLVWVIAPTDASGNGEYSFTFPYVVGDLGLKIYQQALCYDPTLNGWGFSVSNDASYVLGDRGF